MQRFLLAIVVLLTTDAILEAYWQGVPDRLEEMVVQNGGPGNTTTALAFTRDGSRLYAAGLDKVVWSWPIKNSRLDITPAQTQKWIWPLWREQRGMIYAMTLSPDSGQELIGVAGFGLNVANLAIIERATGKLLAGLDPQTQVITTALTFAPNGKQILYGDDDGRIWQWSFQLGDGEKRVAQPQATLVGKHAPRPGSTNRVRLLHFIDNGKVLSVAEDGHALVWDLAKPGNPEELDWPRPREVLSAIVSNDNRWLVATSQSPDNQEHFRVSVLDVKQKKSHVIQLPNQRHLPRSLAIDAQGKQLAIGVDVIPEGEGSSRLAQPFGSAVYRYDLAAATMQLLPWLKTSNRIDAMAFSPNGNQLAVAGGDDFEVTLWDLEKHTAAGEAKRLGHSLWSVALSKDGKKLGVRSSRQTQPRTLGEAGKGPWEVFDLRGILHKEQRWSKDPEAFEPVEMLKRSTDGWQVVAGPDLMTWLAVEPSGQQHRLPLDLKIDQQPRCFGFLPAQAGSPSRLVVGHYFGATVFDLVAGQEPKIRRKLVGHSGDVTGLGISADGKLLVTSGRDSTVAAYSLVDWPGQRELGGNFEVRDGKLLLKDLAAGSPLWEAFVNAGKAWEAGDEIDAVGYFADNYFYAHERLAADPRIKGAAAQAAIDKTTKASRNTPDAALRVLNTVEAAKGLSLHIAKKDAWLFTSIRQRPVWKLFLARNPKTGGVLGGEWVLWRWRDYFYTTSTHGDSLIGWHVTRGIDRTPEYHPAEHFRKRFEDRNKVEEVLTKMTLAPERIAIPELLPPHIRIEPKAADGDQNLVYTVTVVPADSPLADREKPVELSIWINDFRFSKRQDPAFNQPFDITIPKSELRTGTENKLTVQVYGRSMTRGETELAITNTMPPPKKVNLYALLAGVSDDSRASQPTGQQPWSKLHCERDLCIIEQWLMRQKGNALFDQVIVTKLLDQEVTRETIAKQVAAIQSHAKPDDHVLVYIAGRGISSAELAKITGQQTPSTALGDQYYFMLSGFDRSRLDTTTLGERFISDQWADLRGNKLLILDASPASAQIDMIRRITPERLSPAILTACDSDEDSVLHPRLRLGLFSHLLSQVTDAGALAEFGRTEGGIGVDDLADYLVSTLPGSAQVLQGKRQTPRYSPSAPQLADRPILATPAR